MHVSSVPGFVHHVMTSPCHGCVDGFHYHRQLLKHPFKECLNVYVVRVDKSRINAKHLPATPPTTPPPRSRRYCPHHRPSTTTPPVAPTNDSARFSTTGTSRPLARNAVQTGGCTRVPHEYRSEGRGSPVGRVPQGQVGRLKGFHVLRQAAGLCGGHLGRLRVAEVASAANNEAVRCGRGHGRDCRRDSHEWLQVRVKNEKAIQAFLYRVLLSVYAFVCRGKNATRTHICATVANARLPLSCGFCFPPCFFPLFALRVPL